MKRTLLLLGGYGFIGTNILNHIDNYFVDDYSVTIFDKFEHHPHGYSFKCVQNTYAGDFGDALLIDNIFKENAIDLVIHSLSSTLPITSSNVFFDINSNIIPTINLLDIMLNHNVKNIIYISSGGAIYGEGDREHSEDDNSYPKSSYGISKLVAEKYLYYYHLRHGISPLILRLSNPYGPYHFSKKQGVINISIKSALSNSLFFVWGDGCGKKDYIYIQDFCHILFELLHNNITNITLNIGSGNKHSVNEILLQIKEKISSFSWQYKEANQLDVKSFSLNTSKLLSIIGEYNFTELPKGIENTIAWYLSPNNRKILGSLQPSAPEQSMPQ